MLITEYITTISFKKLRSTALPRNLLASPVYKIQVHIALQDAMAALLELNCSSVWLHYCYSFPFANASSSIVLPVLSFSGDFLVAMESDIQVFARPRNRFFHWFVSIVLSLLMPLLCKFSFILMKLCEFRPDLTHRHLLITTNHLCEIT